MKNLHQSLRVAGRKWGHVMLLALAAGGVPAAAAGTPASALSGEITIGGTGAALGLMERIGEEFRKTHPGLTVKVLPSLGSGGGIKALRAGLLTLSVSSRPLTPDEQAAGLRTREIARTPLVFVAGPGVKARNLTQEQLVEMYAGRTTHWPGGMRVRPVLRPTEDIDTVLLKRMSPAMEAAVQAAHQRPGKNIAITDTDSANELERIPGALGTSTLALLRAEKRTLDTLSIEGVSPVQDQGANPRYPYQKSLYLITPAQVSAPVQAFLQFIDSPEGMKVLAQNGTLPLRSAQ